MRHHESLAKCSQRKQLPVNIMYVSESGGQVRIITRSESSGYHKKSTSANISQLSNKQRSTTSNTLITYLSQIFIGRWDLIQLLGPRVK